MSGPNASFGNLAGENFSSETAYIQDLVVWNSISFPTGSIPVGPQGSQGLQGVQGPQGQLGPQGSQFTGPFGELYYTGNLSGPNASFGNLAGENFSSETAYIQDLVVWNSISFPTGSIPAGPQGSQGLQGPQGSQGQLGPQGSQFTGPFGDLTTTGNLSGPNASFSNLAAQNLAANYVTVGPQGMVVSGGLTTNSIYTSNKWYSYTANSLYNIGLSTGSITINFKDSPASLYTGKITAMLSISTGPNASTGIYSVYNLNFIGGSTPYFTPAHIEYDQTSVLSYTPFGWSATPSFPTANSLRLDHQISGLSSTDYVNQQVLVQLVNGSLTSISSNNLSGTTITYNY